MDPLQHIQTTDLQQMLKTQHEYKPNFQKLILILEFKLKLFGSANVNFAKNIFVYI